MPDAPEQGSAAHGSAAQCRAVQDNLRTHLLRVLHVERLALGRRQGLRHREDDPEQREALDEEREHRGDLD